MRRYAGFTLIEVIIVLVIAGILAAVALPSFNEMIRVNRLAAESNTLVGILSMARSEAIKQGRVVTLCARMTSMDYCASGGSESWDSGWILYVGGFDGLPNPDTNTDILRVGSAIKGGHATITSDGTDITDHISYLPSGRSLNPGTLTLCDSGFGKSVILDIGLTGRVHASHGAC